VKVEARTFLILVPFFLVVWIAYGLWSDWEAVGSAALLLLAGLAGMTGYYLVLVSRRIDARPEDDPLAEIEQGAGELGVFPPWSWWPLVAGVGIACVFTALAIGWWLFWIGIGVSALAIVGWTFEYSRGQHAH